MYMTNLKTLLFPYTEKLQLTLTPYTVDTVTLTPVTMVTQTEQTSWRQGRGAWSIANL
jgi:hypothetical protein